MKHCGEEGSGRGTSLLRSIASAPVHAHAAPNNHLNCYPKRLPLLLIFPDAIPLNDWVLYRIARFAHLRMRHTGMGMHPHRRSGNNIDVQCLHCNALVKVLHFVFLHKTRPYQCSCSTHGRRPY